MVRTEDQDIWQNKSDSERQISSIFSHMQTLHFKKKKKDKSVVGGLF
jgi:hypothetical protein